MCGDLRPRGMDPGLRLRGPGHGVAGQRHGGGAAGGHGQHLLLGAGLRGALQGAWGILKHPDGLGPTGLKMEICLWELSW